MPHLQPSWTPILKKDGTYCSPACGCGCKLAAFDEATQKAAALVATLGDGWTPRVWENMGWHYAAMKGCATVYPPNAEGGEYRAYLNSETQFIGASANPAEAVGAAIDLAHATITKTLNDLDVIVGPKPSAPATA